MWLAAEPESVSGFGTRELKNLRHLGEVERFSNVVIRLSLFQQKAEVQEASDGRNLENNYDLVVNFSSVRYFVF